MKKYLLHFLRDLILGMSCGGIYYLIEIMYRGYSHWSMFALGAFCGVFCIDHINNYFSFDLDYSLQILISSALCTLAEGLAGLYVNVYKGWGVWNYSSLPFTFFWGQCNLFFCFAWIAIVGLFGIFFCDAFNYYVCGILPRPYYRFCGKVFLRFPYRKWKG